MSKESGRGSAPGSTTAPKSGLEPVLPSSCLPFPILSLHSSLPPPSLPRRERDHASQPDEVPQASPTTLHFALPSTHKTEVAVDPEGSQRAAGKHVATRITSEGQRLAEMGDAWAGPAARPTARPCFEPPLSEILTRKWKEKWAQAHVMAQQEPCQGPSTEEDNKPGSG